MRQDDFKNRYIIKLFSSIGIAALNIIIQLFLPRAFTVDDYGYYTYNLNVFTSIVVLANLSTSNALVSKFSKRNEEIGILFFYLRLYAIEAIVLSLGVCILFPLPYVRDLFAGQTLFIVLLGLEVSLILKFQNDVVGVYDAMAISRVPASYQIKMKVLLSTYVVVFYLAGHLNLALFYIGQFFLVGGMVIILLRMLIIYQKERYPVRIDRGSRAYVAEYYSFCRPLVVASIVAQIITILMNWALMKWSGTNEQAMFGAAWQLNTLVSFVFSPYAELSKREYAVVSNDKEQIRSLYDKSLRMMLWLTAYFALYIGFCANWLLPVVYGDKYNSAVNATLLIMFYTVYQAAGQICGAFMIATEKTKLIAIISVIGQFISLALIFMFQIPNLLWPQGLGAIGIAIVYALGNFISVCISMVCISRSINLSIKRTLVFHIVPIAICSILALCLNKSLDALIIENSLYIYFLKIIASGVIYTAIIASVIWIRPDWAGISKETLKSTMNKVVTKVKWRRD